MRRVLLALTIAGALIFAGCGGSDGPYRADCEKEVERSGLSKDSQFWENGIEGCEEALKSTHAPKGIFKESESEP